MTDIKLLKAIGHPDGTVQNVYEVFGTQNCLLKRTLRIPDFINRKIVAEFNEDGERKSKRFFSFSEFCRFSKKIDLETCTISGMVFLGINKNGVPIYSFASVYAHFKDGTVTVSSKDISAIWEVRARISSIPVFPLANIDIKLEKIS